MILVLRDATPIIRTEYIDFGEMCDKNILWPCTSKASSCLYTYWQYIAPLV